MSEPSTPRADRPLLRLEGVSAQFEGQDPLAEISLEFRPGEIVVVTSLDASASKSTLLKVAAGLLEPQAGRVLFQDQDVYRMGYAADQRFRNRCAYVPRSGSLLANRTVWENVALPLEYHQSLAGRELKLKVSRLLELTGYAESPHVLPEAVSPRARRLASFSRALALDPELVLVDRFFDDLELLDWRRLFEVVLKLNQHEGISWVLVCDLDPLVFQIAERVAVLERDRLLAFDFRQQLFRDARIEQAFLAARGTAEMRRSARMSRLRRAQGELSGDEDPLATLNVEHNMLTPAGLLGDEDPQATLDLSSPPVSEGYQPETEWEQRLLAQLDAGEPGSEPPQEP